MATKKTKVEVYGETSKYERSMRNVRRITRKTSQDMKKSWKGVAGAFGLVTAAVSALGVGSLVALGKKALESGDRIHKLNIKLGVSTELLSQLEHMTQLSGVGFESAAKAIQKMQENISDAAGGIGTARDSLKDLGLSIEYLHSLSPERQLDLIADAMLGVTNQADKTRIAADIFGMRGVEMIQLMSQGSKGLREMREEADRLGITLSQVDAQAIADANDAMTRIKTSIDGLVKTVLPEIAPLIEEISNKMAIWIGQNNELISSKIITGIEKIGSAFRVVVDNLDRILDTWKLLKKYGFLGSPLAGIGGAMLGESLRKPEWETSIGRQKRPAKKKVYLDIIGPGEIDTLSPQFSEKAMNAELAIMGERLEKRKEFNEAFATLGKSQYQLEVEQVQKQAQLWEEAGVSRIQLEQYTQAKITEIQKAENQARLDDIQSITGTMASNFQMISEMGGRHSKQAFAMYKTFKIVETTIATYSAAMKAFEALSFFPPAAYAAFGATVAFGLAQVAMIKKSQPPSYDQGGISTTPGMYYSGVPEAHIPLQSGGTVPVQISGARAQGQNFVVVMRNPVFQDLGTQRQVFAQIAEVIARRVAPSAVIENYEEDGAIRSMVRSRR